MNVVINNSSIAVCEEATFSGSKTRSRNSSVTSFTNKTVWIKFYQKNSPVYQCTTFMRPLALHRVTNYSYFSISMLSFIAQLWLSCMNKLQNGNWRVGGSIPAQNVHLLKCPWARNWTPIAPNGDRQQCERECEWMNERPIHAVNLY